MIVPENPVIYNYKLTTIPRITRIISEITVERYKEDKYTRDNDSSIESIFSR